jgi:NAD(P)-dependent dehydrogenase (short-subunit alcohol dehydrogenase family)
MHNPFTLNAKTILVTGASSGIGKQVAISCSNMGAKVCITGRDKNRLNDTFKLLQGTGHWQAVCDLTVEEQRNNFIESLPALDGFAHCAGIITPVPIKFIEIKHIKQTMEVNFDSAVLMVSRLLKTKKLNKNCSLVFFSSISAHFPHNGGSLYSASKAAIEAYSRNLAREMKGMGLRSNCVVPAMVDTPMYEQAVANMNETAAEYSARYPLGIGKPEDVANATIFLLSRASRWITGTSLSLDGGYTLTVL